MEGFYEDNTKLENSFVVSTSKRKGHLLSKKEANKINIKDYIKEEVHFYGLKLK